jgi:phospholipid/cholesterol/gamma-HCH transport system permease protein
MSAPALPEAAAPSPDVAAHFDEGQGLLALSGRLTIARAAELEPRLAALVEGHSGPVRIDLSGVERMDTVGAWLVHRILRDRPGSTVEGAADRTERLIAEVADADQACAMRPELEPFVTRELRKLGRYMFAFWHMILAVLGFVGTTLVAAWTSISSRRGVRWGAVTVQMEQTGVNALGIVGLMSFLIGIVMAQQGAVQLQQFGAEIFVINLVGRATFRELGVLLTAIMIAGRSASAFAAQIGSMKLAEEVDAMRTIGLDPVEVLVLPRVIAMILMMPLLAFFASVLAVIGGGLFTWISLDIPPATFVQRLREVVPMSDFWIGLSKAPVFGAIIAIIGCFQGFQVTDNAESVGMRTTLAVVQAIFVVIVLDAFFAVFYSALGFN